MKFLKDKVYKHVEKYNMNFTRDAVDSILQNSKPPHLFIRDIMSSKDTRADIVLSYKIMKNYMSYTEDGSVNMNIALYPLTGHFHQQLDNVVDMNLVNRYFRNASQPKTLTIIEEQYLDVLEAYINSKEELASKIDVNTLSNLINQLTSPSNEKDESLVVFCSDVLLPFLSVYNNTDITKRSDLIKFEVENGYFDEYVANIKTGNKMPPLSLRIARLKYSEYGDNREALLENIKELKSNTSKFPDSSFRNAILNRITKLEDVVSNLENKLIYEKCWQYYSRTLLQYEKMNNSPLIFDTVIDNKNNII